MDEQHITNAMVWAERSGAFAYQQLQEFHSLIRLLQGVSITSSDVQGNKAIDQGSFGVIEIASFHGAPVAVKNLSQSQLASKPLPQLFRELFLELQILARVRHPSVVTFMGAAVQFPSQDSPEQFRWRVGLVFEMCGGGNLFNSIHESRSKYSGFQKIRIGKEIAMGLSYLHSLNIIHRDLSSRNILLTDDKQHAKIADFGCARKIVGDRYNSTTISGSPCWMSPEQLSGGALTLRADVWSYGIMLWELAKEQKPYGHGAPDLAKMKEIIFQTVNDVPTNDCLKGCPRHTSEALCRLIAILLQAQAALRPSAAEALQAMQELEKNASQPDDAAPRYKVLDKLARFRDTGARLLSFYDANNPGKIDDLPRVMQLYHNEIMKGDLSKLNADLRKRYNADLDGRYDPPVPETASEEDQDTPTTHRSNEGQNEKSKPEAPNLSFVAVEDSEANKQAETKYQQQPQQPTQQPTQQPSQQPLQQPSQQSPQQPPKAPKLLSDANSSAKEAKIPLKDAKSSHVPKDVEAVSLESPQLKSTANPEAKPKQSKVSKVQAMISALEVGSDNKQTKSESAEEPAASGGAMLPEIADLQQFVDEPKDEDRAPESTPLNSQASAELEEKLQHFYSVFNPEYLVKCQAVANHYLGKEEELNRNLRDRYGADLNSFQARLNQLNHLGVGDMRPAGQELPPHPHNYAPYVTPNLGPGPAPGMGQPQGVAAQGAMTGMQPGPMDYNYPGASQAVDQHRYNGGTVATDGMPVQEMSMSRFANSSFEEARGMMLPGGF